MTIRPCRPYLSFASLALLLAACNGTTDPDSSLARGADPFTTNSLDDYDAASLGAPGTWEVAQGRLTATGPANQSVRIRRDASFTNGYVETVSSHADDGGLVLRFTGEQSYYLLAFRDDSAPPPRGEYNLAVYRRAGGEFRELARGYIEWPRGTPRTIRFQVTDSLLQVFVDGNPLGEVTDDFGALPPGRVGLRHYGATEAWVTRFDELRWSEAAAQ